MADLLIRYNVQLPSTQAATKFHHSVGHAYRKVPTKVAEIGQIFDHRTVIIYAFKSAWTLPDMRRQAAGFGGRVVGVGTVTQLHGNRTRRGAASRTYWLQFQRGQVSVRAHTKTEAKRAAEIYERSGHYGRLLHVELDR